MTTYGDDALLPFEQTVEDLWDPEAEVRRLRRALVDVLGHVNGDPAPAYRVRAWRELAGLPAVVDEPGTPKDRRDEGIARAAARWTDEEVAAVDNAIRRCVEYARNTAGATPLLEREAAPGVRLDEFTTADVWAELGPGFPVTKGIAGRMLAAKNAGLIANTGRTVIAPADATGPNHGQRLTVWRAL